MRRTDGDRRPAGGADRGRACGPGTDGRSILDVTLAEGRNRIVRRWAEAMGLKVDRLARLSYGPVRLGDLAARPLPAADAAGRGGAVQGDPADAG